MKKACGGEILMPDPTGAISKHFVPNVAVVGLTLAPVLAVVTLR